MNDRPMDALWQRLQEMQELYAEFFVLMNLSVQIDVASNGGHGLDRSIDEMMDKITCTMALFREDIEQARQWEPLPPDLDEAIAQFNANLRDGLQAMVERVRIRRGELTQMRQEVRSQLQTMQRKKKVSRGYRSRRSPSLLLESET